MHFVGLFLSSLLKMHSPKNKTVTVSKWHAFVTNNLRWIRLHLIYKSERQTKKKGTGLGNK